MLTGLCRLAMDGSDEECLRYAEDLKKSLVRNSSFREEFAEYAAESLAFALGLRTSVQEPSDHGFDAVRRKDEPERADESGRSRLSAEVGVQDAPQHTEKGRASPESAGKAPAAWPGASGNSCSQRRSLNGSARSAQPRDDPEALYVRGIQPVPESRGAGLCPGPAPARIYVLLRDGRAEGLFHVCEMVPESRGSGRSQG